LKKYSFIIVLLSLLTGILFPLNSHAQRWKRTRYEVFGGAGPTLFFGEVGGSSKSGSHFMSDVDLSAARYFITAGIRYKIRERIALKLNLVYGRLYGNDALTKNQPRKERNAKFHTIFYEPSMQAEISILKERLGTRFTFKNINRFKITYVNVYVFVGIGGMYFYPTPTFIAVKTNKYENYKHFSLVYPIGVGFKYAINRRASLGLEFGQRYTRTDYIDGISDKYSRANDSYYLFNITVTYKLKTTRSGLPTF
jgi:hypothetical protein